MSAALDQHYKNLMGNLNRDGGGMVGWRERDRRWGEGLEERKEGLVYKIKLRKGKPNPWGSFQRRA